MTENKHQSWINVTKAIAIIFVLIDHISLYFPINNSIKYISYNSVSLFILIMSILLYSSLEKKDNYFKIIVTRISKIYIPYILCAFVSYIITFPNERIISLINNFICKLLTFSVCNHFYYVFLYIKLVLYGCLIHKIVKKINGKILFAAIGISIFLVSVISCKIRTFDLYGGAGCIFGGTYLFIVYIGMCISKAMNNINDIKSNKKQLLLFICILIIIICFDSKMGNYSYLLYKGINPPNLILIIESLIITKIIYLIDKTSIKFYLLNWIGKHTLYIYLYHWISYYVLIEKYKINNYFVVITLTVLICLGVELLIKNIRKILLRSQLKTKYFSTNSKI